MHTIFINTTKNIIGSRVDALRHEKESKNLLCVDCPLETWFDNEKGYTWITRTISKYIDTYNGVGNDFNLIIYSDLEEAFKCAKINFSEFDDDNIKQEQVCIAYKGFLSRFFIATLLDELNTIGRKPASTPLLLIEQPETDHAKYTPDVDEAKKTAILDLMHILPMDELKLRFEKAKKADNKSLNVEDVVDNTNQNAVIKPAELYNDKICAAIDDVMKHDYPVEKVFYRLAEMIDSDFAKDAKNLMKISDYCVKKRIREQSKEEDIKHDFLVQCFILDCVSENTLYVQKDDKLVAKGIPDLSKSEWENILSFLAKKKKIFETKRSETVNTKDQYVELGLAPPLYEIEKKKFGLNEVGTVSVGYEERKITEEENKKDKKKKTEDKDGESTGKIELIETKGEIDNWLKNDGYDTFDYKMDKCYSEEAPLLTAKEYSEKARALAERHLNIINDISTHITGAMSRYSARSLTNQPPILRKRSVDSGTDLSECEANDYKYAKKSEGTGCVEDNTPADATKFAKQSYITIMLEYLKFDSQRCIAIKTIEEQCKWVVNKINQIEESLKKLFAMFIVLAVFLTVLYVPFVLVQWEAIVKNLDTMVIALASVAAPFLILYVCYLFAKFAHRRKMRDTWEEYVEKAKEAAEDNRKAAKAYDDLMTKYIPALRWIYEYALDVEFHRDCCRIANTKLKHHSEKLGEQSEIIGNLLEDLDYIEGGDAVGLDNYKIDYTIAFCEGENKDFYSIISKEVLDIVYGRGGTFR